MSAEIREPDRSEAPPLARFLGEYALAVFGEAELSEDEVRHWFSLPGIWMRVAVRNGRVVGYLDVVARADGMRFDVDARTLDRNIAEALLSAAEEHARPQAGHGAVLRGYAPGQEPALAEVFARDGWVPIRHFFQMQIELGDELPEPRWPEGIAVRTFRSGEEARVYEAQMAAFADHWDFHPQTMEEWLHEGVESPRFDPSLWWLAEDGGEVAGLALTAWHHSDDPHFGWVAVLGVRPAWRRRGLGKALLLHSFGEFRRRGATRVGLGVDAENTAGAVRLYERAGMKVARRHDAYEKTL